MPSHELPDFTLIDKNWTLFLDRDGVINYEKKDDYIRNVNEFNFYKDVLMNFSKLSDKFGKILVVSNQRGVGRKLMTEEDLVAIHEHMRDKIEQAGGRVDGIYYCTSIDTAHIDRKPNPGMALRAKKEFPRIDFTKSLMVGNKLSDMQFARNAGMFSVFLATTHGETAFPHPDIDFRFNSFGDFIKAL